jgi:phosphoglycolate phosphatase
MPIDPQPRTAALLPANPKLVIFDCDGTLIDSQDAIVSAMDLAFRALGLAPPRRAEVLSVVGLSLPEAFAALAPTATGLVRRQLALAYKDAFTAVRARPENCEPVFPGAGELLTTLSARPDVALGIATGKSRRGVERLLARDAWRSHFATIQTADDHPSKPHPAMIEQAMAEVGASARDTIMVGDSTYDMAMARAAGVGAVGVSWGYHAVDALEAAGAHTVVHGFDALLAALRERLGLHELVR